MHTNSVGTKLKRIRLSRDITLKELADKTGLTNGYLSRIENCRNFPPISTLSRIAEGLGIDISYFFIDTGRANKNNLNIVIDRQSASLEGSFLSALLIRKGNNTITGPSFLKSRARTCSPLL